VPPASTVGVEGATATESAGTVTLAAAFFVGSATDVAVMVTVVSLGGAVAGAV